MAGQGRPTKYREEYNEQAEKLCRLGATDADLADFFKVNVDSIHEWKKVHPSFSDALKRGKEEADNQVVRSLYQRAIGYNHPEDKFFMANGKVVTQRTTKHYPPDPVSMIFWLKNRRPEQWREKPAADTDEPIKVEVIRKSARKDDTD